MTAIYDADENYLLAALREAKFRLASGTDSERKDAPSKIAILGDALYRLHNWEPPQHVLDELSGVYDPAHDDTPIQDVTGETRLGSVSGDLDNEGGQSSDGT